MKFRDLERGPVEGRVLDFEMRPGRVVSIRVIPFIGDRFDAEIEAGAGAYVAAENRRRAEETPGAPPAAAQPKDPTYERGIYAHTVLRAVLDPSDGQRFFASVEEILAADGLDRDRLAMLFELQQQAQADFAPRAATMTGAQYFEMLERTARAEEGADLPFEPLPRATQRSFVRGIARSYLDLLPQHLQALREMETLRSQIEQLRSEIASLRGKSGRGPSSPDGEESSGSSAGSNPPAQGEAE